MRRLSSDGSRYCAPARADGARWERKRHPHHAAIAGRAGGDSLSGDTAACTRHTRTTCGFLLDHATTRDHALCECAASRVGVFGQSGNGGGRAVPVAGPGAGGWGGWTPPGSAPLNFLYFAAVVCLVLAITSIANCIKFRGFTLRFARTGADGRLVARAPARRVTPALPQHHPSGTPAKKARADRLKPPPPRTQTSAPRNACAVPRPAPGSWGCIRACRTLPS